MFKALAICALIGTAAVGGFTVDTWGPTAIEAAMNARQAGKAMFASLDRTDYKAKTIACLKTSTGDDIDRCATLIKVWIARDGEANVKPQMIDVMREAMPQMIGNAFASALTENH